MAIRGVRRCSFGTKLGFLGFPWLSVARFQRRAFRTRRIDHQSDHKHWAQISQESIRASCLAAFPQGFTHENLLAQNSTLILSFHPPSETTTNPLCVGEFMFRNNSPQSKIQQPIRYHQYEIASFVSKSVSSLYFVQTDFWVPKWTRD